MNLSSPVSNASVSAMLRAVGLRATRPRIRIYQEISLLKEPVSVQELHLSVGTFCDLVSVYRTLGLFENLGVVERVASTNGVMLYQLKRSGVRQVYITDTVTGSREALDSTSCRMLDDVIQSIREKLEYEKGYSNVSFHIGFQGNFILPQKLTP